MVVTPGSEADFYIDGAMVGSIRTGVPSASFLLEAAEIRGDQSATTGVAVLDVYGGLLG